MKLDTNTSVETILEEHPAAADWLLERGVVCLRCGEPFWGSLGELLVNKGYTIDEIERIVAELNEHLEKIEKKGR